MVMVVLGEGNVPYVRPSNYMKPSHVQRRRAQRPAMIYNPSPGGVSSNTNMKIGNSDDADKSLYRPTNKAENAVSHAFHHGYARGSLHLQVLPRLRTRCRVQTDFGPEFEIRALNFKFELVGG